MEGDSACLVAVQVCLHLDADMCRDVLLSAESSTQRQHLPGFPPSTSHQEWPPAVL